MSASAYCQNGSAGIVVNDVALFEFKCIL